MANRITNPGWIERFFDKLLAGHRKRQKQQLDNLRQQFAAALDSDTMDNVLELLLAGMSLLFWVDTSYRANIRGFNARYGFTSADGKIAASVIFKTGWLLGIPKMVVKPYDIGDTHITVQFKDGPALANLLLSARPDIFTGILEQRLSWKGNLNYILKFIYMARHIPKHYGIEIPALS